MANLPNLTKPQQAVAEHASDFDIPIYKMESSAMIDLHLHFRNRGNEQRSLPAVPSVGDYIFDQATTGLWQVSAVVFDAAEISVYCARVSSALAGELIHAWATWGEATRA
jgi:hypothetical protein